MKNENNKEELLKSGSFGKLVLSLCLPTIIIMLVNIIYNMADLFFVGKMGDPNMTAAISLCTPIFTIITGLGTLFGSGGCTFASLALGNGKKDRIKPASAFCFIGSIIVGLICLVTLFVGAKPIANMLGADINTISHTMDYIRIIAIGAPFMMISGTYCNLIRADGAAVQSMIANLSGTILNIVLDALFVLVFNMGVMGAALATVIGNVVSSLMCIIFVRKNKLYSFNPKYISKDKNACGRVIALGFSVAISNLVLAIAKIVANNLMVGYGVEATTGLGISTTFTTMVTLLAMGICVGIQPALSYAYSSKDNKRLKTLVKNTAILTFIIGCVVLVVGIPFRSQLINLFIKNSEVISVGGIMVIGCFASAPFGGLAQLCQTFLQSTNKASFASILAILEKGLIYIPVLLLLAKLFKINGIAFTPVATEILTLIIGVILCIYWVKHWNKTRQQESYNN